MTIVPLRDASDAERFGGKASALAHALRVGLPVPDGFALDWDTVANFAEVDFALRDALRSAGGRVAVRSSAIGEDSVDASFAGQHATILNVTTDSALLDAINTIRASAHHDGVLEYRQRMNIAGAPRIAIVLQRMVEAEAAGVLFTRDPVTGAEQRVIESAWGLGEAVVAGLVTPDRFRIAENGTVLSREAGRKDIAIRYGPDGGTVETPLDDITAARLTLDDAQLAKLNALAKKCEQHFGGPQDIEWAFAGGELYLLQSRPVTRMAEETITPRRFTGLALAALLAPLNSTIIAVALPSITTAFDASAATVTRWMVTAYLVVSIVAQSPAGKIADRWGTSRVLTLGRSMFGLGALLAAFSPVLTVLGTGRVLMALGGALSVPTVFAQLRRSVPQSRRGRVFGVFGAIMGAAAAAGPLIGGFLTSRYGWHSVFFVNVPVVLLSLILEPPRKMASPSSSKRSAFDVLGSVLLAAAVILLVMAVSQPLAAIAAVAALVLFVLRELRIDDPVLDVRLFTHRAFAAGSGIVALQNLAMYSLLFLIPFLLARNGHAASSTGRMLLLFTAGMVLASPIGGWLSDAIGPRLVALAGALIATAGAALFVARATITDPPMLIAALIVIGAGIGITTSPSQAAALGAIPANQAGVASGALSTMRYAGGVVGSGLVAMLVANGVAHDARLIVFPVVLLASAALALFLPGHPR